MILWTILSPLIPLRILPMEMIGIDHDHDEYNYDDSDRDR
jgi:hypothetical protein